MLLQMSLFEYSTPAPPPCKNCNHLSLNIGTYKRLIAVINSWLSENFHSEGDGSNAPSWWKIVDVVADDIGGADPNLAKSIAQNWQGW